MQPYLVHVARRAMATQFEVSFSADQFPDGTEVALEALELLDGLEQRLSVFRPASDISRINRLAAEGPVEVEPGLFGILELAMRLYAETGGAYDITSGPLSEVWGFARRAGAIPTAEQLAEARRVVGGHLVELDFERRTVRFLQSGVRLNLGSIGKGYAVDRCAERLVAGGVSDFLIHGGQSSVLARGSASLVVHGAAGGASHDRLKAALQNEAALQNAEAARENAGWTVGIRDPLHPRHRLSEVRLRDQALGTSGAQFQSFRHKGRRYGHILDPRTGQPAEGVLSATVVAPTATLADALSTAFYVLGPHAALAYCREHLEIAALLTCPGRQSGVPEIHSAGL